MQQNPSFITFFSKRLYRLCSVFHPSFTATIRESKKTLLFPRYFLGGKLQEPCDDTQRHQTALTVKRPPTFCDTCMDRSE
jgi:hypothetical protein